MSVRRDAAVVGQVIDLRANWTMDNGQAFDPYELRRVQIVRARTGEVVVTLGAREIERVEQGEYQVLVGPFTEAETFYDRWTLTPFEGQTEIVRQFRIEVAAQAAVPDLITSREELIRDYLYGLDLTDDNGVPYPDSMFVTAIKQATAAAERVLDISIQPIDILAPKAERHDYHLPDYIQFATFKLDRRPVREIVTVKAIYPGNNLPIIDFPADWVQLTIPEAARIELVPAIGSLANYIGQRIPLIHGRGAQLFPGLFHIEYRAGFAAGQVPADIKHLVSLLANFNILNPAGDMLGGAGVASYSLSMGGLSQSISTTSSATNAGYGSRLIQYDKEIKRLLPAIRNAYHGPSLHVV